MKVFKYIDGLQETIETERLEGKTIGFVPTMGALHEGHVSLIECAKRDNDLTIVSIFVNPTQFNDVKDFKKYPRTITEDLILLNEVNCDLVYTPLDNEIYPESDVRQFDLGYLDTVMEGKHRSGHFNGVAQVVTRLFELVRAHRAYFGKKDFQQLAVIRHLVDTLHLNIEVVACPTIREADGLAMSSRNKLLSPAERRSAAKIPEVLFQAVELSHSLSVNDVKQWVEKQINETPLLQFEYFDIVDDRDLMPIYDWNEDKTQIGCIAVYAGSVRLIDNVTFS